jgi:hypothetical protein
MKFTKIKIDCLGSHISKLEYNHYGYAGSLPEARSIISKLSSPSIVLYKKSLGKYEVFYLKPLSDIGDIY